MGFSVCLSLSVCLCAERPGFARTRTLTWVNPNPNPDQVLAERPEGGWPGENYRPRLGDHRAYSGDGGRGACAVM